MISRPEFVSLCSDFIKDTSNHLNSKISIIKDHFLEIYIETLYKKIAKENEVELLSKNFGYVSSNFHKIIESKLAEKNFDLIFELDKFARYVKYAHYDLCILYEKMKEEISLRYENELSALFYDNKKLEGRMEMYKEGMIMDLREFVVSSYHSRLVDIKSVMSSVLKEKIKIVNKKNGIELGEDAIDRILDDEMITDTVVMISRLRLGNHMKLNNLIDDKEKERLWLEERLAKDQNLMKKMNEMLKREAVLKTEVINSKDEIKLLENQNYVLKRDINQCNFERITLSKEIAQREIMVKELKIQIEKNKSGAKRQKKLKLPVLGKRGEKKNKELRRLNQSEDSGTGSRSEEKKRKKEFGSERKMRKSQFVFKNGKIEKKFKMGKI